MAHKENPDQWDHQAKLDLTEFLVCLGSLVATEPTRNTATAPIVLKRVKARTSAEMELHH